MSTLVKRTFSTVILLSLLAGSVFLQFEVRRWFFTVLCALLGFGASWECYGMLNGPKQFKGLKWFVSLALVVVVFFPMFQNRYMPFWPGISFNILSDGWFSFFDENGNAVTKDAYGYLEYAMGNDLQGDLPLFIYPRKRVGVKEVADIMRDHFEGTPMDMTQDIGAGGNALPYRWRPMEWKFDGKTYVNERAIATQQTGFWMVGQARSYVPDVVGGILWFGTDDAATSYLTPIYTSTTKVPECFREGNGDLLHYSPTASFWINNRVSNACYKMYNVMAPYVREKADAFERDQMEHKTHSVDSMAVVLYNQAVVNLQKKLSSKGDVMISRKPYAKVVRYVTDYTVKTAQNQFKEWKQLEETLLVKFMDGNVKPQNPDGTFKHSEFSEGIPAKIEWPGYTELWKETVAQEHGEVIQAK